MSGTGFSRMNTAIIPARGGSQRIPRKNIKLFHGRPMIAWSIQAALDSDCFDQVLVSTDDSEIAAIARECGANTPFVRPSALSDHHSTTGAVMAHAVQWLQQQKCAVQAVCCVYATAPFVQAQDIKDALHLLQSQSLDYVFSATTYGFPIQRAFHRDANGRVRMIQPEHLLTRSQDLPEAFHDAAQFYWGTSNAWLLQKPVFSENAMPFVLPRHRVQDIDTPQDWTRAELMFSAWQATHDSDEKAIA
jgi:pseudaminic acid cytidylyltransferase